MPYVIRSYEGQDEWVSKKWLAHMNLGNDIYMSFFGATKKEAEDKASAWYEKEKKYMERIDTSRKEDKVKMFKSDVSDESDKKFFEGSQWGKQHHLSGKIWMVKDIGWGQKEKIRIDKSEEQAYLDKGFVRGGPRS